MNRTDGRLVIHDRKIHLACDEPLVVGDTIEVVRGNGPREGARMGVATVVAFDELGAPVLDVRLGAGERTGNEPEETLS